MRLKSLLTGFCLCLGMMAPGHPLHLTFTSLAYKPINNSWILTVKVFSDDFATSLKNVTGYETLPGEREMNESLDDALRRWLGESLVIWFDGESVPVKDWKFNGLTVRDDASWITYSFRSPVPLQEVRIRNRLLMELFSDQKNLFVLTMGRLEKAHEFRMKDQETVFLLNKKERNL